MFCVFIRYADRSELHTFTRWEQRVEFVEGQRESDSYKNGGSLTTWSQPDDVEILPMYAKHPRYNHG